MRFLLPLIAYFTLFFLIHAQNPFCSVGIQHNHLLNILTRTSHQPFKDDYVCVNTFFQYTFDNFITYGDSKIFSFFEYLNVSEEEKQSMFDFLNINDHLDSKKIEVLLDSLESIALKKQHSAITLGFWSVAKHSFQFWKDYSWDDDKKPPFLAIVKADALGLIKGIVLGAVFWIGSNFIFNVPDSIGILGGSVIAVGFTALDSFRFSRKYKKRSES